MQIALLVIARHLGATEPFEQTAARRAVALIAARTSIESVQAHAALLDERSRAEVSRILTELGEAKTRGDVKRTTARLSKAPKRRRKK